MVAKACNPNTGSRGEEGHKFKAILDNIANLRPLMCYMGPCRQRLLLHFLVTQTRKLT